jgi:GTP 3',8-cyclase
MHAELQDRFGRRFSYLRLSITDACNFRCAYCLPDGYRGARHAHLSREEIGRLIRGFAALGIRKLRITGGEPLLRSDVVAIVADAAATAGIERVAMTTNGYRLADMARPLRAAGLAAVNVSLDTLDPARFEQITGDRRHARVLRGIHAALESGIPTVKINTVLLQGMNDHEVPDLIALARDLPLSIRFIELMQTAANHPFFSTRHFGSRQLMVQLAAAGWEPLHRGVDDGPALEYRHPDYLGRVGVIAPYQPGFCDGCNRLRVTAEGALRLCLFGRGTHDLRPYLQEDASTEALECSIAGALFEKPPGHRLHDGEYGDTAHLALTGG